MKLITTIIVLTFIYSCKDNAKPDKRQIADNNFLTGEWRLDSSSNHLIYKDKAIILEDGSFYLFSGSDGGSLKTTGKRFRSDSISTEYYGNLSINSKGRMKLVLDNQTGDTLLLERITEIK